jgi:hypothetical protein
MSSYKQTKKVRRRSNRRKTRHSRQEGGFFTFLRGLADRIIGRKKAGGVRCDFSLNENHRNDIQDQEIKKVCKSLQSHRGTKFGAEVPVGNYKVYWKALQPTTPGDDKSLYKVCHNYSLFSLLGGETQVGIDSSSVQVLLASASCQERKTCNSTGILPRTNTMSREISTFPIRLYQLKPSKNKKELPAHSARFEGGRWWHKFYGINALVSIEGHENEADPENFFKYNIVRQFNLTAYKVPAEMFENGVETIQSTVITIV